MKRIIPVVLAVLMFSAAVPALATTKVVTWSYYADTSRTNNMRESIKLYASDNQDFSVVDSNAQTAEQLEKDLEDAAAFIFTTRSSSSTGDQYAPIFADVLRRFVENGGLVIITGDFSNWAKKTGLTTATYNDRYQSSGTLVAKENDDPMLEGVNNWRIDAYWLIYDGVSSDAKVHAEIQNTPAVITEEIGVGRFVILGYDFNSRSETPGRILVNALEGASVGLKFCKPKVQLALDKRSAKAGDKLVATASVNYKCDLGREVEVKLYRITADRSVENLLPGPYFLSLIPNDQFEDVTEITVPSDAVAGPSTVGIAIIDPVTGESLAKHTARFNIAAQ